ncbi:phosphatidate cytidylyltransferase [Ancylomarina longa]|uniref:phosphatidate cytidylyltransferase n=1 Tax=Ancylomarina longa TaxID=2487017 RepID=UPI001ADE2F08|nr:phosphatidate cytidylyltransferase [Ancylomarina longa]
MGNFVKRTFFGAIFAVVLIAGITLHTIGFLIVFLAITLLGTFEFYQLVRKANCSPQIIPGMIAATILFVACYLNARFHQNILFLLFTLSVVSIPIIELYRKKETPFTNIAFTIMGLAYIALPFSLFSYMTYPFSDNRFHSEIVLGIFLMVWANDSGAYLVGVNFGKHRLFERISPKKSWEGSIGGAIVSLIVAYICSIFCFDLSLWEWLFMGAIVVVFGSLGDLIESLLKRSIQIKDSGNILPGHGGILDRFDAILLVSPVVFVFLQIIHEYFR